MLCPICEKKGKRLPLKVRWKNINDKRMSLRCSDCGYVNTVQQCSICGRYVDESTYDYHRTICIPDDD